MKKILVVDDSQFQRMTVANELKNSETQVIEAGDGLEGLEACKKNPDIDLIICDLNMPHMNGLAMVKALRELEDHKTVPVLMLTTDSSSESKTEGKKNGVTGWILKPMSPGKLAPVVDKLISSSKRA